MRSQTVPPPGSSPSGPADGASAQPSLRPAALAGLLGLVTGVQALATFAVMALPTLATRAAPAYGLGPEAVGYQISVVYIAAATVSGIAGLLVRRYGAATASLFALGLGALGLVGIASGSLPLAILASLSIGSGYALTNPAASHLLLRFAPTERRNLIFALKQTGVPIGAVIAALLLPPLAERWDWQMAIALGIGLFACLAVPLALSRPWLDDDRSPGARIAANPLAGLGVVLSNPMLRAYALMGLTYAAFQFCLAAFLIIMLVQDFGWSLVAAGVMATGMQIGGGLGRIAWSLLADAIGRGVQILMAIGVLTALAALGVAAVGPSTPVPLLAALMFFFGFCLVGWNGLWMAEIARISGPKMVGLATGGVLMFTFSGVVVGPAAFASIYKLLGSYALTFGVFSVVAVAGVLALWRGIRNSST